jgi:hypothetical protein
MTIPATLWERAAAVQAYITERDTPLDVIAERFGVDRRTLSRWARIACVERRIDRKPPINHGTQYAYSSHRCRCDDCRSAHAFWMRAVRARRRARTA